jgi:hypothetical protein
MRCDRAVQMNEKVVINLNPPMPASDDCLPHAAMTLGSVRGAMRPRTTLVHRLVIQEQSSGYWIMNRMDDAGGFVGDTSHPTKEDALRTARREFGIEIENPS